MNLLLGWIGGRGRRRRRERGRTDGERGYEPYTNANARGASAERESACGARATFAPRMRRGRGGLPLSFPRGRNSTVIPRFPTSVSGGQSSDPGTQFRPGILEEFRRGADARVALGEDDESRERSEPSSGERGNGQCPMCPCRSRAGTRAECPQKNSLTRTLHSHTSCSAMRRARGPACEPNIMPHATKLAMGFSRKDDRKRNVLAK